MYRNAERTIKKYVSVIVCILLVILGGIVLLSLFGIFGGVENSFSLLVTSFLACLGTWISGAFLYAFADLVENSKLQTEILVEILNTLHSKNTINNKNSL